jgi:hypothetical protein
LRSPWLPVVLVPIRSKIEQFARTGRNCVIFSDISLVGWIRWKLGQTFSWTFMFRFK